MNSGLFFVFFQFIPMKSRFLMEKNKETKNWQGLNPQQCQIIIFFFLLWKCYGILVSRHKGLQRSRCLPSSASVVPYEQLFLSMHIGWWLLLSLTSYSAVEPNICDSSSVGQEKKPSQQLRKLKNVPKKKTIGWIDMESYIRAIKQFQDW